MVFAQRDISVFREPTCLPWAVTFSQALRLTISSFPHFQAGGNMEGTYSPTSGTNPDIYACPPPYFLHPLFLFLSDTAELFLEPIPSDKFSTGPSTRGGEGGPCEGLGPNRYCFLCQVSTNRGLSHPFLTPHP